MYANEEVMKHVNPVVNINYIFELVQKLKKGVPHVPCHILKVYSKMCKILILEIPKIQSTK